MSGRAFLVAPASIVAAMVVDLSAQFSAPLSALWRPLLVVVVVTLVLQVVASFLMRDAQRGAYVAALLGSITLGIWAAAGILLLVPAWRWTVMAVRRRQGPSTSEIVSLRTVASVGAPIAFVLLLLAVGRASIAFGPWTSVPVASEVELPGSGGPDIFVVMLDGYPRADTLRDDFGIDNSTFRGALESGGFVVDDAARSNYMKTWLSVASLLHMDYVDGIPALGDPPSDPVAQYRLATRVIDQAPLADALRRRGYDIVATTSAFIETDLMSADRVLEPIQPTSFEHFVLEATPIARLLDTLAPNFVGRLQLNGMLDGIEKVRGVAREPSKQPIFLWAHLMAPHVPFLVDAAGEQIPMPDCYPASCTFWDHYSTTLGLTADEYGRRLAGYLEYTNDRVLDLTNDIVAARPTAVVILLSDHGSRYSPDDPDELFHSLFAARTPGREDVFETGTHPVNVFRQLFNAYFGTDLPMRPYGAWISTPLLLDLVPWDAEEVR